MFGRNEALGCSAPAVVTFERKCLLNQFVGRDAGVFVGNFLCQFRFVSRRQEIAPVVEFFADIESQTESDDRADDKNGVLHFDRARRFIIRPSLTPRRGPGFCSFASSVPIRSGSSFAARCSRACRAVCTFLTSQAASFLFLRFLAPQDAAFQEGAAAPTSTFADVSDARDRTSMDLRPRTHSAAACSLGSCSGIN